MSPLDPSEIDKLLKEEEATQSNALSGDFISQLLSEEEKRVSTGRGGRRGPRVDPTSVREINVWFKLPHHICHNDCEHRKEKTGNPERGCWNPDCVDPRSPETDRGVWVVVKVKEQWVCRYCFLAGYLK